MTPRTLTASNGIIFNETLLPPLLLLELELLYDLPEVTCEHAKISVTLISEILYFVSAVTATFHHAIQSLTWLETQVCDKFCDKF